MWNRDEVRGKVDRMKGGMKEKLGDLKNDERLREEGQADRTTGEIQEGFGRNRRKVGEVIKDLGDKIGR